MSHPSTRDDLVDAGVADFSSIRLTLPCIEVASGVSQVTPDPYVIHTIYLLDSDMELQNGSITKSQSG